jgi:uncharacterized membrane protein
VEDKEELKWGKATQFGPMDSMEPVLTAMLAIIEAEKQKTLDQIEQAKKMLENIKNQQ